MINHGNRGVPSFRIQISPFSYECPVSCPSTVHEPPKLESHHNDNQSPPLPPPQRELSPYAWWVSSRSSPFAVSRHHHHHHHQHHHHHPPHHHHHSTWNSDFSTSIFQVPNGVMKVTGSSIHRYRKKRHWSLC